MKRKLVPHVGRETIRVLLESHDLKPWREKMRCVGKLDEEYIAKMEDVLKIYEKPLSESQPLVRVDEKPVVLHRDTRPVMPMQPGKVARRDYECKRCGTVNVFCGIELRTHSRGSETAPYMLCCSAVGCDAANSRMWSSHTYSNARNTGPSSISSAKVGTSEPCRCRNGERPRSISG